MKKLLVKLFSLLLIFTISSCGSSAVLTEEEQAEKYGLSPKQYREVKQAALSMNMSIEQHLKMLGPIDDEVEEKEETVYPSIPGSEKREFSVTGTIISNTTADIYPRRMGVVSDILVDVGDRVRKGQTVARMLPVGVASAGYLISQEKREYLSQAEIASLNAQNIRDTSISLQEQKIETAMNELRRAEEAAKEKEIRADLAFPQAMERALSSASIGVSVVSKILFNDTAYTKDSADMSDTNAVLGSLDRNFKQEVLRDYLTIRSQYENLRSIQRSPGYANQALFMLTKILQLLSKTRILLDSTTVSGNYSGERLAAHKQEVDSKIITLQRSRDELQNAVQNLHVISSTNDLDITKMREQLNISEKELETVRSREDARVEIADKGIEAAKASYNSAVASHLNTRIVSPFSGVVAERFFNVGETVTESKSIFRLDEVKTTLSKTAPLEVKFRVPDAEMNYVKLGDVVKVYLLDYEERQIEAEIYRKSSLVDPESHTFVVQAKIDKDENVPANSVVKVDFEKLEIPEDVRPVVPKSAVLSDQDGLYVLQEGDEEGVYGRISIEVAETKGDEVSIASEIDLEKKVLVSPKESNSNTEENE